MKNKINYKLIFLCPMIALLLTGCNKERKNIVTMKYKNKIVVKDIQDGRERLFYAAPGDNRYQYLQIGDTVNVLILGLNKWIYDENNIFNDNGDIYVDYKSLKSAEQRIKFDSVKNEMLNEQLGNQR